MLLRRSKFPNQIMKKRTSLLNHLKTRHKYFKKEQVKKNTFQKIIFLLPQLQPAILSAFPQTAALLPLR